MVISSNPEPNKQIFQLLLDNTLQTLDIESKKNQDKYLGLLGNKLENVVADVMTDRAKGTPFENSIELISGQKFPDIIANKFYGIEVKTTKQNHWTTTGNSVLESTRVDGIERIFMLFGKMVNPVEFKCRPYEDCLSEVVVTHSPRYLINMDLQAGNTIFDKLDIPYDTLRNFSNPLKPITDYYRQFLKPGEEVWWLDQEEPKSTGLIIKLWNNLPIESRKQYMLKSMVLFPEIFSNRPDKFNRLAVWLVNSEGIVCPNIRDVFTAGGQGIIEWKKKQHSGIPQILIKLSNSIDDLKIILDELEIDILEKYWNLSIKNKVNDWIGLINENSKKTKSLNLDEYLKDKFASTQS
ncbi:MAG: hypothetical protein JW870_17220 [Candidatus Delongbacteria bacterium]|nr:hypothetical protein [Candidatus Delongbacteria bacterium]